MKRGVVYYVVPVGDRWAVRAAGSPAEMYRTLEEALAAAEDLTREGASVRVLRSAAPVVSAAPASVPPDTPRLTGSD